MRPFRFGYQARGGSADELRDQARRAEAAGFDLIHTYDHLSPNWSPTLPLLAMAEATTRLRVSPLVINNDFHHPAVLREDLLELDGLSFDDAAATPFLAYGTHDEIAAHLLRCRERWGISYFSVRSIDDFQPVIERLRMADSAAAPQIRPTRRRV